MTKETATADIIPIPGPDQRPILCRWQRHARAKSLRIRLDTRSNSPIVTSPPGVEAHIIEDFIFRHRQWIIDGMAQSPAAPQLAPGAIIPLAGASCRLQHAPGQRSTLLTPLADQPATPSLPIMPSTDWAAQSPQDYLHQPAQWQLSVGGDIAHFARRLRDALRLRLKAHITPLALDFAARIDKKIGPITIRDTVSRWGSCSAEGNLSFCWRLAFTPLPVIRYLVAHEVAHRRHLNHAPAFWALVFELDPAGRTARQWLRQHGPTIMRIT